MEIYVTTTIQLQDWRSMEWMSLETPKLVEEAMIVGDGLDGDVDELTGEKMLEDLRTFFSLMSRLLSYRESSQPRWIRDEWRR